MEKDWPLWVAVIVFIQIIVLLVLLSLLARKHGWRKLRIGFFAEREFRDDEE